MFDWEPEHPFPSLLLASLFQMNKSACEIICLQFAPWERLRSCLRMFKGLQNFQRQRELLKQEARDKHRACLLSEGSVWAANQTMSSTERTAFCTVSSEVVFLHYLWLVMEECCAQIGKTHARARTHTHTHTHTQLYAAAIMWPERTASIENQPQFGAKFCIQDKNISVVFITSRGTKVLSLLTTSQSSPQSALFVV